MQSKTEIERDVCALREAHGTWSNDIPLPCGIWTRGNEGTPHTRLRRIMQAISDLALKPLEDCRILDLGCLDGLFSIECGLHGATVVGVEARTGNIEKARFAKRVLNLDRVEFVHEDVTTLGEDALGPFDVIICSGLLYHLDTPDLFHLVRRLYGWSNRLVVIDTHVALAPVESVAFEENTYWGRYWEEHGAGDTNQDRDTRVLASYRNNRSFVITRPSLLNLLNDVGFSSVYECLNPAHINFGREGLEHKNRCTFIAVKGNRISISTSPTVNHLSEDWPEGSLTYATESAAGS